MDKLQIKLEMDSRDMDIKKNTEKNGLHKKKYNWRWRPSRN